MFTLPPLSDEEAWRTMSWTAQEMSPALPMLLAETPTVADSFDQLERIGTWEKIIAWAQAHQYAEMTRFMADAAAAPTHGMTAEQAVESAQAEIGLMLTLSPGAAAWRVTDARTLVQDFPATFAALESGAITLTKARIIAEGCADVAAEIAAAVEDTVLPRAPRQTRGQLRAAVARAVQREDAAAARRRRERKTRGRSVVLYPERDGMATLSATLPAAEAVGVFAVLDEHARACGSADGRPTDARRADALTDLVLGAAGFCSTGAAAAAADGQTADAQSADGADAGADASRTSGPPGNIGTSTVVGTDGSLVRPVAPAPSRLPAVVPGCGTRTGRTNVSIQIRVIVPLDSLRGVSDEPAELAGYGPISAAQARELASDPSSTWRRLVTDPLSGGILDHGTTRYRPPPEMAERVITRSRYCQFPGCRVPAHRCDLDHNEPFDPIRGTGPTSDANLGPKCRPHHRLKGMRGWTVHQYPDGSIEWITPTGHRYLVEPPPLTEPRIVPTPDDGPAPF